MLCHPTFRACNKSFLFIFFCVVFAKKNSDFWALKYVFILLHFYLILGPVCPVLWQDLKAVPLLPLRLGEAVRVVHAWGRVRGGGGKGWRQKSKPIRRCNRLSQTLPDKIVKTWVFAGGGGRRSKIRIFCLDVTGLCFGGGSLRSFIFFIV